MADTLEMYSYSQQVKQWVMLNQSNMDVKRLGINNSKIDPQMR